MLRLAHEAGQRIAGELGIPVYFYEHAALRPDRVKLENVRRRGFEELRELIGSDPDREPDVGALRVHETAGAIAVGARPFLIAFNVNLRTSDIAVARQIARAVRAAMVACRREGAGLRAQVARHRPGVNESGQL